MDTRPPILCWTEIDYVMLSGTTALPSGALAFPSEEVAALPIAPPLQTALLFRSALALVLGPLISTCLRARPCPVCCRMVMIIEAGLRLGTRRFIIFGKQDAVVVQ